jgi:enoyl-CoA hydratase/carnithine racemase
MAAIDQYVDSSVSIITLADSAGGNRLNPDSIGGLITALNEAAARTDVRAVLIRSDGPAFCHGMDLDALRQSGWNLKRVAEVVALYTDLLSLIYTLPKPVVAAIRGDVKAGGVGLAAACDCVIGTPETTFEMAEVLFGIVPANVLPFLLGSRLTIQKARYLILTAKKVAADEALRLGLLDEVAAPDELEKTLKATFKRLLTFSPKALAETKSLTRSLDGRDVQRHIELTKKTLVALLSDPETQQAIEGFLEGDLPAWRQRFKPDQPLIPKE